MSCTFLSHSDKMCCFSIQKTKETMEVITCYSIFSYIHTDPLPDRWMDRKDLCQKIVCIVPPPPPVISLAQGFYEGCGMNITQVIFALGWGTKIIQDYTLPTSGSPMAASNPADTNTKSGAN